jgi:hypothetical protein
MHLKKKVPYIYKDFIFDHDLKDTFNRNILDSITYSILDNIYISLPSLIK